MRLLAVALLVFAWSLPVAQALDVDATWSHSHHDVEFAPPGAQPSSFAMTKSRSSDPPAPDCSTIRVERPPTTVSAAAQTALSAPAVATRATRWILRHATTSAIP